jgi:hypothetical protein
MMPNIFFLSQAKPLYGSESCRGSAKPKRWKKDPLGLEQKDVLVEGLATRWQRGTLVMPSSEMSLPVLVAVSAVGRTRRGEVTVAGSIHSSTKSS